jgi:hypothetical protein
MPRKPFLLRIDPEVLEAVQRWADEDLRSINGQIEFILRQALTRRGVKLPAKKGQETPRHAAGEAGEPESVDGRGEGK